MGRQNLDLAPVGLCCLMGNLSICCCRYLLKKLESVGLCVIFITFMQDLAIEIFSSLYFPCQLTGISCRSRNKVFYLLLFTLTLCPQNFNSPVPALFHQRSYDMPSNFPLRYLEIRLCCFQEKQFQMGELITMNLFLTWSNIKKLTGFRMQFSSSSKGSWLPIIVGV